LIATTANDTDLGFAGGLCKGRGGKESCWNPVGNLCDSCTHPVGTPPQHLGLRREWKFQLLSPYQLGSGQRTML